MQDEFELIDLAVKNHIPLDRHPTFYVYPKVDATDLDLLDHRWALSCGYAVGGSAELVKTYHTQAAHRIVLQRKLGRSLGRDEVVDHINGDRLDDRRLNLRPATVAQNAMNHQPSHWPKVKYKGVSEGYVRLDGTCSTYKAQVSLDMKMFTIGYFPSAAEAAWMHDQYALELHGDFARTNLKYR